MPEWQGQLHLEMFWCADQEERTQTLDPRPCLTLPGRENHLPSKVALSPSNNHPFPRAGAAALNDNVWPKREGILPLLRINHNESSLCHCSGLQTPVGVRGYTCVAVPARAPRRSSGSVLTHLLTRDSQPAQRSQCRSWDSPRPRTHQSIPAVQPVERTYRPAASQTPTRAWE